jgi:hypothetical protein
MLVVVVWCTLHQSRSAKAMSPGPLSEDAPAFPVGR